MHRSDIVLHSPLTSLCANMLMETRFCVDGFFFQVFAASMQCIAIKKKKKKMINYMYAILSKTQTRYYTLARDSKTSFCFFLLISLLHPDTVITSESQSRVDAT